MATHKTGIMFFGPESAFPIGLEKLHYSSCSVF